MTTHERSRERLARRIALGYLAVVAAVFAFVAVMVTTAQGDPLIGIWLAFVTAPTSLLLTPLQVLLLDGLSEPWLPIVGFTFPALAGLFQGWLLWVLIRGRRQPADARQD